MMIGEDVEYLTEHTGVPYGGAFKVSKDLSEIYNGRVRNTPISEPAIVGVGTGLALSGVISIVEIMFGDFTTLIVDQIQQHAAKFKKMYAGKVNAPVIVRTPMGGRRGYGPTHSQSIESLFYSILGLRLVALNQYIPPAQLYNSLVSISEEPALVIENKTLYTQKRVVEQNIYGYEILKTNENFPQVKITPKTRKHTITILCYGGIALMIKSALESLIDNDIFAEVIIPSSLKPLNLHCIAQSVKKTSKLLTVEEGNKHGGILQSVVASLIENGDSFQLATCHSSSILSCAIDAELDSLPDENDIVDACLRMV
jgi:2-oxoisovalerate dehydrogenase E1 component